MQSSQVWKTGAYVSLRKKVFQVERILFSKLQFLVRDDKHVMVQVFARFGKILGFVWSRHKYLIFDRLTVSPKYNNGFMSITVAGMLFHTTTPRYAIESFIMLVLSQKEITSDNTFTSKDMQ